MPYGTVNADVISTSVANTSLGAGNATRFKNRIINGDMRIDQRNAGASKTITATDYTLDRWQAYCGGVSSKFSVQQNSASVTPPVGFINYLGAVSLSAYSVSSTDRFGINQSIEGLNAADLGWGTANAKTVTLSFWVRSSLTGTFGGSIQNYAATRSYPFSYTITTANTWELETITIAGDTSGTWLTTNSGFATLNLAIGTGSTYSGTAGAWATADYRSSTSATSVVGTSGATFYITGVQLEVGTSATGFEYVDYTTQLAMCQRYFQITGAGSVGRTNTTQVGLGVTLKVPMRITGVSISLNNTSPYVGDAFVAVKQGSSSAIIYLSTTTYSAQGADYGFEVQLNGFSGFSANNAAVLYTNCLNVSAEL